MRSIFHLFQSPRAAKLVALGNWEPTTFTSSSFIKNVLLTTRAPCWVWALLQASGTEQTTYPQSPMSHCTRTWHRQLDWTQGPKLCVWASEEVYISSEEMYHGLYIKEHATLVIWFLIRPNLKQSTSCPEMAIIAVHYVYLQAVQYLACFMGRTGCKSKPTWAWDQQICAGFKRRAQPRPNELGHLCVFIVGQLGCTELPSTIVPLFVPCWRGSRPANTFYLKRW